MFHLLITCFLIGVVFGANNQGVLSLDTWTFDKVVDGSKNVLVKFDKEYAYGTPEDEFKEFAKMVGEMGKQSSGLVVAEVGKQDYGDKKNSDLHERFDIESEEFPVLKLFKKGSREPVSFSDEVNRDNLSLFVRSQAGIWIGIPGCLEEFDKLAEKFMKSESKSRDKYLNEATILLDGLDADSTDSGKAYVRIMKKVIKEGDSWVEKEISRVTKLKDGKVSEQKKKLFELRLNVLKSYKVSVAEEKGKEEL